MKKIRHSFSIRVNERESRIIDELKNPPYHINMSNFLREKILNLYCELKNGKSNKK